MRKFTIVLKDGKKITVCASTRTEAARKAKIPLAAIDHFRSETPIKLLPLGL